LQQVLNSDVNVRRQKARDGFEDFLGVPNDGNPSDAISNPANHGLATRSTFVATAETAALRVPAITARAVVDNGIDAAISQT